LGSRENRLLHRRHERRLINDLAGFPSSKSYIIYEVAGRSRRSVKKPLAGQPGKRNKQKEEKTINNKKRRRREQGGEGLFFISGGKKKWGSFSATTSDAVRMRMRLGPREKKRSF